VKGFEEIIGRQSPESCVVFLKMCVALFFYGPTCSIIYVVQRNEEFVSNPAILELKILAEINVACRH